MYDIEQIIHSFSFLVFKSQNVNFNVTLQNVQIKAYVNINNVLKVLSDTDQN